MKVMNQTGADGSRSIFRMEGYEMAVTLTTPNTLLGVFQPKGDVAKLAINAAMTVKRVLAHRTPVCWVTGFGEYSVQYILRFWIGDPQGGLTNVRGQVYLALWDAFKKRGITLPYPQREIRILTDPPVPPPEIADPHDGKGVDA